MLRLNMEAQAQAIQGMERARVLGEELQRAKVQIAELAAEVKMRDEALQAKEALLESKDDQLQSKDVVIQSKDDQLQSKDALLQEQESTIRLLHADIARFNAGCAAGGAAPQPAPAPAAAANAAAQGEAMFQEGQRLYGEQRFSEAAERWGRAALQQHGPSYAHLSDMRIDGRPGVAVDVKRSFELATAGAALGCMFVRGQGVAQDYAEAVRLYRLAAAQGHAVAQMNFGGMFENGRGVAQDRAEAIRWYRLAAAQGLARAQAKLDKFGA
jgi:TPR repeat protein